MRLWHLTKSTTEAPNQRYECHLGIPRVASIGFRSSTQPTKMLYYKVEMV